MDDFTPVYVANELLAYVFCYFDADNLEDLKVCTDRFYTSDAVIVAKNLLWEHYNNKLPAKKNRNNRGTKTPKEKNLDDILEAVKTLDETEDVLPIEFCAVHLNNLPSRRAPVEHSELRHRVTVLEAQMAELLVQKQSRVATYSEAANATARSNGNPQRSQQQRCGSFIGPAPSRDPRPIHVTPVTHVSTTTTRAAGDSAPPSVKDCDPSREGLIPSADDHGNTELHNDHNQESRIVIKDGAWHTYRKRKPAVYGKRKGNADNELTVKGAAPRYEYVVFNIHNDIEQEALQKYIVDNGSSVLEINKLSKPDWSRQSFRVLTYLSEKDTIMNADYWPELVGVRPFMRRRMEKEGKSKIL